MAIYKESPGTHGTPGTMFGLLKQCFCCSLHTGAIITGVYATAVYIVAFALEVWLINEAKSDVPVPSYILCVGYFINWTMSVVLMLGLALKRTRLILFWQLSIITTFFPECGLVLFTSLYHWTLESSFGAAVLIFWVVRALLNILCLLCVFSLYAHWKEEKRVSRRLRDITMTSPMSNGLYTTGTMKTPLPGSLRAGFHNPAYLASQMNLGRMHPTSPTPRIPNIHRSISSLSHYSLGGSTYRGKRFSKDFGDINELDAVLNRWKQKQATMLGLNYGSIGTMGIAGVGLDPHELPPTDPIWNGPRTISMQYLAQVEQYLNGAPLSRPVSTALILTSPLFDRQSQFVTASPLRKSHSMVDLNRRRHSTAYVTLHKLERQPFDYLTNKVSLESDDLQRYKDVAL